MDKRFSSRRTTITKHKQQTCKVYVVKFDHSHLGTKVVSHLEGLFREAKWFYNFCLSHENINDADTTAREVPVKVEDQYEIRNFEHLGAHMKQAIKARLFGSLVSLKALKEKGFKVGRLKFKSVVNSIPLKEYGNTYCLDFDRARIRIAGLKQWIRVRGINQIPKYVEFANATFVRKNNDYYLNITTYTDEKKYVPDVSIGIDFGCETQLTFSNGIKLKFQVEPSRRLRRLDRKILKKRRAKSNNQNKDYAKRAKEYEHLTNRRKDIRHKVVNAITSNYNYVCFQDESIHAWAMSNHGKKIQYSGIGGIISDLKHKSVTPIMVSKFFPSTQLCPDCGQKNKLRLEDRTYTCNCGYTKDRDWKSAICIENEGLRQIPTERREFTPGEISTSTLLTRLSKINGVSVSKLES